MKRRDVSPPPLNKKRSFSPPLPPGWSRWFDKSGRPYFINGEDGSTTWEDPRAPVEEFPPHREPPRKELRGEPYIPPLASTLRLSTQPLAPLVPLPKESSLESSSPVQLHISGIDGAIDESQIRAFFGKFDRSIVRYVRAKDNYCFLHFGENLDAATRAVRELDGLKLAGRVLRVQLTNSTIERYGAPSIIPPITQRAVTSSKAPSSQHKDAIQVHVGGLLRETTEEDLKEFFRSFGAHVLRVYIKPQMGYGFVHFDTMTSAIAAIHKLNGKVDKFGRMLTLQLSSDTTARYGQPPTLQKPTKIPDVEQQPQEAADEDRVQLYVGGLNADVTSNDIWDTFAGCPVLKVHRTKDGYCFIHLPDINTALDVMRDKDNGKCGPRHVKISLSGPACKRYGVPPQPHRKPQLILRGLSSGVNEDDIKVFLGDFSSSAEEIAPAVSPGEWSVVMVGVDEAISCQSALDGKFYLGTNVEVRLSDASSRCLNLPPRPNASLVH